MGQIASNIVPTDTQAAAIKTIVKWYKGGRNTPQVFYLAGYAGTGKSTIAKFVVDELAKSYDFNVVPAAYTGKAANVLRQKGNPSAITFHGGMYIPFPKPNGQVEFHLSLEAPFAAADLIIGDECSMINARMGMDAETFQKKILIMGDPGQLPPIEGYGYWTKRKPDIFLTEVLRQALDSPIIRLATMARKGKTLPLGRWKDNDNNLIESVLYNSSTSEDYNHLMTRTTTQAICGTHNHRKYFTRLRRAQDGYEGQLPQRGETLLCCKNDNKLGIFNGCFGTLLSPVNKVSESKILIDVKMDDLFHPLYKMGTDPHLFQNHFRNTNVQRKPTKGVQEFDWGYILTCHKSQGSEWDDVTVLDDSGVFGEHSTKWLYTAITRASKSVTILNR